MMHLQGPFYIEKAGDRVRILHKHDGEVAACLLTRSEFASAIGYVSERGETGVTHGEALQLLDKEQ